MRLLFKQRFFSWLDSYDIYDENGNTVYTVEGKLSWGHCLHILNASRQHIGTVQEVVMTFLPKFELYIQDSYVGCIAKEFTFFKPRYKFDFNDWRINGKIDSDFLAWDYEITDGAGCHIATISKELFHLTDHYVIDVERPEDSLMALMVVLAIDAEKCSRD